MKYLSILSTFLLSILFLSQTTFAQNKEDWPNLGKYHEADSLLMQNIDKASDVVFMGNSITELWGDLDPDFFSDNGYINRGISGQTTPQMLIRFRQDVIHLQPKLVLILAGTNDLAGNTGPSTVGMIEDNLASMAEIAQANHIKVILCSLLPAYDYPWKKGTYPAKKIVRLNQWIKDYCQENGCIYLDYYTSLVNGKGGMIDKYSKDGVHPNLAGYHIMEPIARKVIEKALQ